MIVVNPTTVRSRLRRPLGTNGIKKKQKDKYKENTNGEKLGQLELCQKERLPSPVVYK
jgi:hypothetical protein